MEEESEDKRVRTINKYPLAFVVFFVTVLLTTFVNKLFSTNDDRSRECMEQVDYLRERVDKLEKQVDDYTKAVMYKDAQIKNRDLVIDSLKYEK
ncbi:hypothetical protein OHD16_06760 [Sphingobacterium sp. ML3W]|uniref:hypothetical protein n=1 Tax=Sphingobacterium sp. ML3W TaxID=1538644 RepID=UPI00249C359C|nr:hypothetical protein [Sphingobacterium sp. ML3W]WFA79670.1 hypothetical protein OGI71_27000 [Sphingobacterium sp. ML3W]